MANKRERRKAKELRYREQLKTWLLQPDSKPVDGSYSIRWRSETVRFTMRSMRNSWRSICAACSQKCWREDIGIKKLLARRQFLGFSITPTRPVDAKLMCRYYKGKLSQYDRASLYIKMTHRGYDFFHHKNRPTIRVGGRLPGMSQRSQALPIHNGYKRGEILTHRVHAG